MKKEYDTFVLRGDKLPDGQECQITIRDLSPGKHKYTAYPVKAIVASSPEHLPDGDTLWVRTELGKLYKEPWKIKIIEKIQEI